MKKIVSCLLVLTLCLTSYVTIQAQELDNTDSNVEIVTMLVDDGYDIIDIEEETINEEKLNDYVIVGDGNNTINTQNADSIESDNIDVNAVLRHYTVEKDGQTEDIYSITAKAAEKYSIGQTGDLIGTICWRDNVGPRNDLLYVSGTYPAGYNSTKVHTYKYRVVGFYNTEVSGSWVGQFFNRSASNYHGLQFTLIINTAEGVSLQVLTTPLD